MGTQDCRDSRLERRGSAGDGPVVGGALELTTAGSRQLSLLGTGRHRYRRLGIRRLGWVCASSGESVAASYFRWGANTVNTDAVPYRLAPSAFGRSGSPDLERVFSVDPVTAFQLPSHLTWSRPSRSRHQWRLQEVPTAAETGRTPLHLHALDAHSTAPRLSTRLVRHSPPHRRVS